MLLGGEITSRHLINRVVALVFLATLCLAVPLANERPYEALTLVGLSLGVNLAVVAILMFALFYQARHALAFVHLLGVWLMLAFAPLALLTSGSLYYSDFFESFISEEHLVKANLVVFVWVLVFSVVYLVLYRTISTKRALRATVITWPAIVIQVILAYASLAYVYSRSGFGNITRAAFNEAFNSQSVVEMLLVEFPARMVSVYAIAALMVSYVRIRTKLYRAVTAANLVALAVLVLAINNPIAAPRFFVGSVIFGFIYLTVLRSKSTNGPFFWLFVLGVFGFLPIDFGRATLTIEEVMENFEFSIEGAFLGDNFRAYEALPVAIMYVEKAGSTYWGQFVGNLLFFIPRSVWLDKPIGSGAMLAEQMSASFTNVACPLPCEGYVNFGLLGVVVLAAAFAALLAYFDYWAQSSRQFRNATPLFVIVYAFLVGNIFFLTRGDLLSPMTFTISMAIAAIPLYLFSKARTASEVQR